MRKLYLKMSACVLSAALALSAAACSFPFGEDTSSVAETKDVPSEIEAEVESEPEEPDTDIGEHKDYVDEESEGYYSNGVLIVNQDGHYRAMDTFLGDNADFYTNELNTLKKTLDDDVTVYSLVAPTACEYYCPSNFQEDVTSQAAVIADIGDKLMDVINVDPCETLDIHNAEPIYSRTDHHWTALGAYYACKVFAKAAGVDYPDISEYEKIDFEGYIGSMAAFTGYEGTAALEGDPEVFTYYKPTNDYRTYYYNYSFEFLSSGELLSENPDTMYLTFLQGDSYCVKVTTDVNNDRKLLVVKDSFGNAAVPFLTSSFEEIYVVDMRYLEANLVELIEEFGITDVVYIMNTFSAVGQNAYNLETLRTQATPGNLEDNATDYDYETEEESESESELEEVESQGDGYVYGIGLNNVVGVDENYNDGSSEEDYYNDYGDGEDYTYNDYGGYDDYSNDGGDYGYYEDDYYNDDDYVYYEVY